jgi:biotin carboxylase
MAYLLVDPVGRYPAEIMPFLARQLGQGAVAVFSSRQRLALWEGKWSRQLGEYVLGVYLAPGSRFPELVGVVAWDEESVLLGAALGERLGLGWNPLAVVERCRDKAVMKRWLARHGRVRINAAATVRTADEARAFQRRLGRWPVVVKPTGGAGSEHVFFAKGDDDLLRRCQQVLESGAGEVLLEEYVGGPEYAVNGQVDRSGDLLVTDVWVYDRRASHGIDNLYFETTTVPTFDPVFRPLAGYAAAVVEDLGLRRAPIHMEVKVDERGPCLIEVGARPAGGNLPLLASRLHGRSLLELAAVHWLGELPVRGDDISYESYDHAAAKVVLGVQAQRVARTRGLAGTDEVERLPSFAGWGMVRPPGTSVPVTRDLETRSWEVYLVHEDRRQLAVDAERVRRALRYV